MTDEKLHQIALTLVPGIGDILIRQLMAYCGSAQDVFRSTPAKLQKIPGIGPATSHAIRHTDVRQEAEKTAQKLGRMQASALFYTDDTYPKRLKDLYDAPVMLYAQGVADHNARRTLALVGTRQATDYGRRVTEDIVQGMKPYGVSIISGLAYGIDIIAHRASLAAQLPTIGVMASGLDVIYPSVHQKTAQEMVLQGGLLTENRPGVKPDARLFPARNRIIAGLSDMVVVVESAAKSGSLITAEYANNYHREVFAVPGQLNQTFSLGCNKLIRENKAQIYTSPDDLITAMNWDQPDRTDKPGSANTPPITHQFTEEESQLVALLRQHSDLHIDDLSWKSRIPMGRLASILLTLEFQGVIRSLPGKKYQVVYV
ncbi:DNA-processing protein DprA [Arsenicibacter rosenii]|uniref:DNA protecting protein DprA n=1 Tax=Arsenicibacter rosenii TaxID=1750698 RepID=A0A1S2VKB5_9BACT|nr:DNA-processing protein DprA [Arsenicibacter rosenii]OIN59173.1 DNA protecting protein DprA [Arsenicibacter rosenii]